MLNSIAISGFEQLSAQQAFDISARHLLSIPGPSITANEPSFSRKTTCDYAGVGCAAAPFIREEERARWDIKNKSWWSLVDRWVPDKHVALISDLQRVHDDTALRIDHLAVNEIIHNFSVEELKSYWTTSAWRAAVGPKLRELAFYRKLNEDAIDEMEKGV